MEAQHKRAKPGDILRLNTPKGFAYLQYIGRHPEYGDAVLINPVLGERPSGQPFSSGYVAFYPVSAAAARRIVEIVDHLTPPRLPQRLRRPGARSGLRV